MASKHITASVSEQNETMQRYYVLQSKIYDLTRWTFLFGRRAVIRQLPLDPGKAHRILEVGCGTGYNLRLLARRFPKAHLTGLDVSTHMIEKATKATKPFAQRVQLEERPYALGDTQYLEQFDAVLFSYSLTMINPQWEELIRQAKADLKPGGIIAVADFFDSRFGWFKTHMGNNHVRMDGHLLPLLEQEFTTLSHSVKPAYGGVWDYFVHLGRKV
ncbi:class I SAM-dependent methyltransferase [Phaeodactylibacter sp.]|jgi:S-adenosylmethionine-diacylgycerolhomoserine-N-methlytransferase|uniref:class I SAM-dependent methyltransferase n=1 Tax=Phaeodactylibacter sp. TaxID=1940289 RepID=UPI0025D9829F|nr:class I SAM-dependent methyltransferase [Phaeodactylibacter sp.]MCI4649251.1 class I SAM-dependent methyltransferase [Phaeodactylibacter sp.]MCI5090704.1 class I SAM-dependent methyltransferase [Phaeodactylibacter sp.]